MPQQPTVLVIDDDSLNVKVVLETFKSHPYTILQAPSGQIGLAVIKEDRPDLILLDWAMPELSGIDVLRILKADPDTEDIPVVMNTGVMTSSEDLSAALEAGAADFIRKPYDKLELISRVSATLRNSLTEKENKRLLQDQIEQKERELSMMAMQAYEKNKFFSELEDQLKQLHIAGLEPELKKIFREIRIQKNDEASWKNFSFHFQNVHPHFFKTLHEQYPDLTNNDIRISSYLKIGINNKEIAQLIGVEVGTVKTNLYRLKKKLGLGPDHSLRAFISTI